MRILITNTFKRNAKKLHRNQVTVLEEAIEKIKNNPTIGELKMGDLSGVRVYKFHILQQLILLAYIVNELSAEITLLYFGSHENFYEILKNQINR